MALLLAIACGALWWPSVNRLLRHKLHLFYPMSCRRRRSPWAKRQP